MAPGREWGYGSTPGLELQSDEIIRPLADKVDSLPAKPNQHPKTVYPLVFYGPTDPYIELAEHRYQASYIKPCSCHHHDSSVSTLSYIEATI